MVRLVLMMQIIMAEAALAEITGRQGITQHIVFADVHFKYLQAVMVVSMAEVVVMRGVQVMAETAGLALFA